MRAWKERSAKNHGPEKYFAEPAFTAFFGRYCTLLPPDEARPVLRELFSYALAVNSEPRSFPLTEDPADPVLASEYEHLLFLLMPALHSLEPELAHRALKDHPHLAAAMQRFPMGMQSVWAEQPKYNRATDDSMLIGHSKVVEMTEALATDFTAAFREAYDRYERDSDSENPNEAPKECWPSTWEFRNILFKAGQHLGLAAEKYLDRIPDPDLRLFAQIELCAALEGLPQIAGTTVYQPSKREPGRSIRCNA